MSSESTTSDGPLKGSAPPNAGDIAASASNGFYVRNDNTIACKVQRAGGSAVTVQGNQTWSPKFIENGRYDIFIIDEVIQFTVHYEGGSVDVRPGRAAGKYVVWADII